jgi:exonuclease VII large subunit
MVRREWDSTNKDLSDMKYSPQQRQKKKEVSLKATQAHRTASPLEKKKDSIIKDKQVNWKDWNLRESVDFESEIEMFVPIVQVGSFIPSNEVNTPVTNHAKEQCSGTNRAQRDALRHLKNVISNSIPDNVEDTESSNDQFENHAIDTDTSALFIKYILEVSYRSMIT